MWVLFIKVFFSVTLAVCMGSSASTLTEQTGQRLTEQATAHPRLGGSLPPWSRRVTVLSLHRVIGPSPSMPGHRWQGYFLAGLVKPPPRVLATLTLGDSAPPASSSGGPGPPISLCGRRGRRESRDSPSDSSNTELATPPTASCNRPLHW